MDLNQLEAQAVECYRLQHWAAGLRLMEPLLTDADPLIRGAARVYKSALLYLTAPTMAPECAELMRQARPLIAGTPRLQMFAAGEAMRYAQYMGDMDAWADWKQYSKKVLETGHADAVAWRGRHKRYAAEYWLTMGEMDVEKAEGAALAGNTVDAYQLLAKAASHFERALVQAEQSAAWYERYEGPWDPHDRICQIRFARFRQGDVLWAMGRRDEAVAVVEPLLADVFDKPEHESERLFWQGRIAGHRRHHTEAVELLQQAWGCNVAHRHRDHHLTMRIAETLIRSLAAAGRTDEMELWAGQALDEAAAIENVGLVYRLQRLLADVRGRVGRLWNENETVPDCAVRGCDSGRGSRPS